MGLHLVSKFLTGEIINEHTTRIVSTHLEFPFLKRFFNLRKSARTLKQGKAKKFEGKAKLVEKCDLFQV